MEDNATMRKALRQQIGGNVRAEMARKRLTQADLATILGIGRPQVSRRLNGTIGFDAAELVVTAAKLGVPVAALLETSASTEIAA